MRPEFDHDEEYLIAYYRKSENDRSVVQDLVTVAISATFFALGYFKSDVTWSIMGFVFVAYLALKGLISGARYNRTISSIIKKYEDAVMTEKSESKAKEDDSTTSE